VRHFKTAVGVSQHTCKFLYFCRSYYGLIRFRSFTSWPTSTVHTPLFLIHLILNIKAWLKKGGTHSPLFCFISYQMHSQIVKWRLDFLYNTFTYVVHLIFLHWHLTFYISNKRMLHCVDFTKVAFWTLWTSIMASTIIHIVVTCCNKIQPLKISQTL
jgi:hypothetical protein